MIFCSGADTSGFSAGGDAGGRGRKVTAYGEEDEENCASSRRLILLMKMQASTYTSGE